MPKGTPVKSEDRSLWLSIRKEMSKKYCKDWRRRHPDYHKAYSKEYRQLVIS